MSKLKKLVILGAGKASRLYPISSVIPKLLVNSGHKTVLEEILDSYNELNESLDEILVIVNKEHVKAVNVFINKMKDMPTIKVLGYNLYNGSARTINHFSDLLEGHNVIFNWSDIIPKFDNFEFDENVVYTYGNQCRYNYTDKMELSENGNVIGIYQYKSFKKLNIADSLSNEVDLADCIPNGWKTQEVKCIDIGDFDKLSKLENPISRSFNSIEIKDDIVIKTTYGTMVGVDSVSLHNDEINWYKSAENSHFKKFIPKIISTNVELADALNFKGTLTMSRVKGEPLYQYMKKLDEGTALFNYVQVCNLFVRDAEPVDVSIHTKLDDYKQEVLVKTIQRIYKVKDLHDAIFGKYQTQKIYDELINYIKMSHAYLTDTTELSKVKYTKLHGDLNFSNIFKTDDSYAVIDPRGYYGYSKGVGPIEYEQAKLLYAMSGYDNFNTDLAWAGFDITGKIEMQSLPGYEIVYKHTSQRARIHLGIIWASLSGYFINNPYKSIASLYKALDVFRDVIGDGFECRERYDGYHLFLEHSNPVEVKIKTKCPSKWLLIDEETGQKYRISNSKMDWVDEKT